MSVGRWTRMPFLRFDVPGSTLSDDVIEAKDHGFEAESMVKLRRDQALDAWRFIDKYVPEGILTFKTFTGWALDLPPLTFEPNIAFDRTDVRQDAGFGDWQKWATVSGVTDISDSEDMLTFGKETKVDRDTAFASTTVEQAAPASGPFAFLSSDTAEFRVWLPSNASGLTVILDCGVGNSLEYDVFEPLADDWNLVRIEMDQPSVSTGAPDLTLVDNIMVEVTFGDSIDSAFYVSSMEVDRTSQKGGEVRWELSFDEGASWFGWEPVTQAWTVDTWCHSQWVERYMSLLDPADYNTEMSLSVRCKLVPSEDLKQTPFVSDVVCGIDFDSYLHWENDIKRSTLRHIETIEIFVRAVEECDGTNQVTLRSHFNSPTVEAVYEGGMRTVNTTADIFLSQSGNTVTMDTTVPDGDRVVIHHKVSPPVKISADRFLVDGAVPEINLSFPSLENDVRHSMTPESFTNRSLGLVYTGRGINYQTVEFDVYCTGNNPMIVADMVDAVRESFLEGFISGGTGFTMNVNDMLPAELSSDQKKGLHARRINSEITAVRWEDLQLTEEQQVRSILPRPVLLPNLGYRGGSHI